MAVTARVSASSDIEKVPITIALTMPLAEWREFQRITHDQSYPLWCVSKAVRDAVDMVSQSVAHVVEGAEVKP